MEQSPRFGSTRLRLSAIFTSNKNTRSAVWFPQMQPELTGPLKQLDVSLVGPGPTFDTIRPCLFMVINTDMMFTCWLPVCTLNITRYCPSYAQKGASWLQKVVLQFYFQEVWMLLHKTIVSINHALIWQLFWKHLSLTNVQFLEEIYK